MNNSTEIEQPYEGQKFTSFDALKKYLEEYGQRNFVKFWIRSSHTRNSLKSKISKTMNPDLKYVCVKFACIFGGEKIRCRGSGIRKSSTYRNLGCPCMINAVVGEDGNHVKLDTVILEHNHVLCKTLYDSLKKTKRKSQTIRNNAELIENNSLISNQELDLVNNEMNYSSATEDNNLKKDDFSNIGDLTNNCEEEENNVNHLVDDVESTQNCLRSIKDKYGRNIKILVVNPENSDNQFNSSIKYSETGDEVTDSSGKEDENDQVPNFYTEICRLCLSSKDKLSPIFNPDLPLKSTVLSFKIMGCASIEIGCNDGLPNNICTTCEANLDIAYNFRIKCENSDSILRKAYLRKDIFCKTESLVVEKDPGKILEDIASNEEENSLQETLINYRGLAEEQPDTLTDRTIRHDNAGQESLYVQFPISCPVCTSDFETYESMLDHLESHTDYETLLLACNICNVICPTIKELQEHMREHLNETRNDVFSCSQCEMSFGTENELKTHEVVHVSTVNQSKKQLEINYLCNVCGKILKSKDRFQSHRNTHEGLRPHICLKCGRGFADRKNMHQHYDVVHLRKAKHECPVCQKKFYTRTKMKSHITMHYGVKPFSCDVCNKTFRLKMNMIKHKKTHSNERPHQCDKCNAAFIDKNMLKRHSYIHGGIRPYPCPVCGHRFSVKFHLKKHLEKSKCSGGVVVHSETYDWEGMAQPETNIPENECVVVYKTNDDNVLRTEAGAISMNILQDYNEESNS